MMLKLNLLSLKQLVNQKTCHRLPSKGMRLEPMLAAMDFGHDFKEHFFYVKVSNLMALSYRERTIAATFTALEKQKKRCYNERIQQIERGSPVIFGALDISETKLSKE